MPGYYTKLVKSRHLQTTRLKLCSEPGIKPALDWSKEVCPFAALYNPRFTETCKNGLYKFQIDSTNYVLRSEAIQNETVAEGDNFVAKRWPRQDPSFSSSSSSSSRAMDTYRRASQQHRGGLHWRNWRPQPVTAVLQALLRPPPPRRRHGARSHRLAPNHLHHRISTHT